MHRCQCRIFGLYSNRLWAQVCLSLSVYVYLYRWMFAWATVFVLTPVSIYFCGGVRAPFQVGTLKELSLLSKLRKSPSKVSAVGGNHQGLTWAEVKHASHSLSWRLAFPWRFPCWDSCWLCQGTPHLHLLLRGDFGTSQSQTVTFKDVFLNSKEGQNLGNGKYQKQKTVCFQVLSLRTITPCFSSLKCTVLPCFRGRFLDSQRLNSGLAAIGTTECHPNILSHPALPSPPPHRSRSSEQSQSH